MKEPPVSPLEWAHNIARAKWGRFAFTRELDGVFTVGVIDWKRRRYVVKGQGSSLRAALSLPR